MFRSLRLGALGILALCAESSVASAAVIFSDGTFSDFTSSILYNPPANGYTATAVQCSSCGDPNQALDITINEPTGAGAGAAALTIGVIENAFTYNPATQGAIMSISSSVDKDFGVNVAEGFNNTFRLVIEQGGNFYAAPTSGTAFTGPGFTGYELFSNSGLVATNFSEFDSADGLFDLSANPNFDGSQITFGLAQLLGGSGDTDTVGTFYYDNLNITVNTVPEPATLTLFGAGLAGAAAVRRRRKTAKQQ